MFCNQQVASSPLPTSAIAIPGFDYVRSVTTREEGGGVACPGRAGGGWLYRWRNASYHLALYKETFVWHHIPASKSFSLTNMLFNRAGTENTNLHHIVHDAEQAVCLRT